MYRNNAKIISSTIFENVLAIVFLVVIVVVYGSNDFANLTTLQTAHIIFRHGERNPMQSYKNDPYSNLSYWPEGWGQLTQRGKLQSYHLGKYIRERYSRFISTTYNHNEVYLQCSEHNRTILSAQAALTGLFGQNDDTANEIYNFTIISAKEDKTIAVSKKCPRYTQLYLDFNLNSEVMTKFNEDFAPLFDIINKNTGMNITYLSRDLLYLADSIIIKKERNLTLPLWMEELYNSGQLQFILTFRFIALDYTKEMKKLRAGPLLHEILENMRNTASTSSDGQFGFNERVKTKMFLYSGHETTMADMLISFGVFDKIRNFPYSSAIFLELHKLPQTNKFFVKLFFKEEDKKEAIEIEIQNCEYFCQIDRFAGNINDFIPKNWEQECNLVSDVNSQGLTSRTLRPGYLILLLGIQGVFIFHIKLFKF